MQTALIQLGGNEWQKGNHHRIYFNSDDLKRFYGLEYDGWKFTVDGDKVSNNSGRAFASALTHGKFWYDLKTGKFASRGMSDRMTEKLIERITEAVDALTDTQTEEEEEEVVTEAPAKERQTTTVGATVRTATGPGIQDRPVHTNRKSGYCAKCGGFVGAGEGHTYYIDPHEAYEHSGWVVEHREGGCN